jgi:hypothetical protein
MKPKPKSEFGKHRTCSQCNVVESDTVIILEVIMPPQIIRRTQYCSNCLDQILDNERNKKADIK